MYAPFSLVRSAVMPDVQVTHGLDGDDRERLVDLDQVQVGYRPPGLG
jgi:hypothetical protein